MNLNYNYDTSVYNTYIIRIKDNNISEKLADRCANSCEKIGQKYSFFSAVDGTNGNLILPNNHHQICNLIKLSNTLLTIGEQACLLSHFLLWVKCVELDKPIVILEHDAIMVEPYTHHNFFNIINYLGCFEQVNGWIPQCPIPPHGQLNENFRFMLRAHAYAIDPMIARQMVAKIIKHGLFVSADVFIRIDEFAVIQTGFFAFDMPDKTTIEGRTDDNLRFKSQMLCE